jgi:hypothetical protein
VHHELEVNTIGRVRPLPDKEDEEGNPIERDNPESSAPLKYGPLFSPYVYIPWVVGYQVDSAEASCSVCAWTDLQPVCV